MNSETQNPLTLEEHRELGREMSVTNARLRELCHLVVSVYGPQNRAAFSALKATAAMERLCQDLQTQVVVDHPGFATEKFYL
jgi:hypothetical protein